MHMKNTFTIASSQVGTRLDSFLVSSLPHLSRSFLQKLIRGGSVQVGMITVTKPGYRLQKIGKICVMFPQNTSLPPTFHPQNMNLVVLFKDTNLVAIDKPVGIVVHPAKGNWNRTLLNGVAYLYKKILKLGPDHRYGLIHRLDKLTSGVILVALTEKGLWHYSREF